jgi:hypothetical protein
MLGALKVGGSVRRDRCTASAAIDTLSLLRASRQPQTKQVPARESVPNFRTAARPLFLRSIRAQFDSSEYRHGLVPSFETNG